jgi:hypothetical protein
MSNAQIYLLGGTMGAVLLGYGVGWIFSFIRELIHGASNNLSKGD